ncbi:unnamed protein product [Pieris macdunnoughi]|uniref:Uncharacterized protein n=1 Tax=Pieris macdunnoughi TaxID=345717 RepID=A0A821V0S2_9NEOP|nr:unnamed protein product [Pieris macdunnoughi]
MEKIVFVTLLASAFAAPGYYVPLAKSTLTTSSQTVDHGSSHILHAPLMVPLAKTTSTHSNQVVDHGMTTVEHHPVVFPATSIYSYKTPDSAITHHSSEVHETVPYYAYH